MPTTAPPPTPNKPAAPDEIDLIEIVRQIWSGRKTIIFALAIALVLGVMIAIITPKVYTASTVMVPQSGNEGSKLGGLGGLAALAGINVDQTSGGELSPIVYPQIVKSIPFKLELMNTPFMFSGMAQPVSLLDYYTKLRKPSVGGNLKKYTVGLPGVIIGAIKGKPTELSIPKNSPDAPIQLTSDQAGVAKNLDGIIDLNVNAKEGILTLTANMPDAYAAAQVAQKAQVMLQQYITEFKIKKAKANLDFIQERYDETKATFESSQVSLASNSDRSKDFTSAMPRVATDRIQAKYTISFSVFQELSRQLEQAKIQVKKDTPVFTILQPVTVPSEQSAPNRPMIILIWLFLGGLAGICIVFGKLFIAGVRHQEAAIKNNYIKEYKTILKQPVNQKMSL